MKIALGVALVLTATAVTAQEPSAAWAYVHNEGEHRLAYGPPNSDAVDVQFRCRPRQAIRLQVFNSYTGDGAEPRRATLRAGSVRTTVQGRIVMDDLMGAVFEADVPAASPVLRALPRGGPFNAQVGTYGVDADVATAAARQAATQFLAGCRGH